MQFKTKIKSHNFQPKKAHKINILNVPRSQLKAYTIHGKFLFIFMIDDDSDNINNMEKPTNKIENIRPFVVCVATPFCYHVCGQILNFFCMHT